MIGLVAGIGLGIAVGYVRIVQQFLEPVLLFFRNLSLLALLPVFVVFFGIGEQSKIAIVVWACFWPIFVTTVGAVNGSRKILLNAARTLGAGRVYIFTGVVLPAAIPGIFPASGWRAPTRSPPWWRLNWSAAHGIGIYINNAALRYQTPQMYAGIIALGLIGILVNAVMTGIEHKATAWQRDSPTNDRPPIRGPGLRAALGMLIVMLTAVLATGCGSETSVEYGSADDGSGGDGLVVYAGRAPTAKFSSTR